MVLANPNHDASAIFPHIGDVSPITPCTPLLTHTGADAEEVLRLLAAAGLTSTADDREEAVCASDGCQGGNGLQDEQVARNEQRRGGGEEEGREDGRRGRGRGRGVGRSRRGQKGSNSGHARAEGGSGQRGGERVLEGGAGAGASMQGENEEELGSHDGAGMDLDLAAALEDEDWGQGSEEVSSQMEERPRQQP